VKKYTLSKTERLKSRKQIDSLFKDAYNFRAGPIKVMYRFELIGDEPLQLGVTAPSRNFKKAVDRNRIKRLMREAWRLNCIPLKDSMAKQSYFLAVFLIYTGKSIPTYSLIEDKIKVVIHQLGELRSE
jgi:ribonuclease P protein component